MRSNKVSGKAASNPLIELAGIARANPWVKLDELTRVGSKHTRSLIERRICSLMESVGTDRQFSLTEVVQLLVEMPSDRADVEKLLVAPANVIDFIPPGRRVRPIQGYLEQILRNAQREVLLMAPFWDMPTLIDLLRCVPRKGTEIELVLLLVHMGKKLVNIGRIKDSIQSIWPSTRIRMYVHLADKREALDYPHAKCLIVDRSQGYLGSANFTQRGMRGHFELGVSLGSGDSQTLGIILKHLWSNSNLFSLAWDSSVVN